MTREDALRAAALISLNPKASAEERRWGIAAIARHRISTHELIYERVVLRDGVVAPIINVTVNVSPAASAPSTSAVRSQAPVVRSTHRKARPARRRVSRPINQPIAPPQNAPLPPLPQRMWKEAFNWAHVLTGGALLARTTIDHVRDALFRHWPD